MSQLTFQQQLWGALAPALVSTKSNSHAGAFAGAGVVVDLRLCEGVIEATESEVCGFQGPTEIFNSLCGDSGKGETASQTLFIRLGPRSFRLEEGSPLKTWYAPIFFLSSPWELLRWAVKGPGCFGYVRALIYCAVLQL